MGAGSSTVVAAVAARILVIDDDVLILKLARLVLERDGREVETIDDISAVDPAVHAAWAQLAIVDMNVGHQSSLPLLRALRAAKPTLIIVGWSADDSGPAFTKWRAACDAFVLKPFHVKELALLVRELLRVPVE